MRRRTQEFQSIHSEGGLLPPDLLRRVIDPSSKLAGVRPEDYGLPQGERLTEIITQAWNRLRKHWSEFRAAAANLPPGEAGTGLTNDKWTLPLLRELGFGLLPAAPSPEIGGRVYAISRFIGPTAIHLVGCGLSLDRRAAGQRGAAAANPHGLVQEFLNRSPDHLWAIVSNGLRFRILRDNQALSRQSYLEFDLEGMLEGELYADFVLLWLVAHASRFAPRDGGRPESCWLERWAKEAEEQGARALGELRGGVERALQILGEGFTSHPKNAPLRDSLRGGQLTPAALHGQLLRLIYRLIFLFVAEDRTLDGQPILHPRDDSEAARAARERYAAHYSAGRLRELAGKIKGSRHGDLWRQFQILVRALSGEPDSAVARESLALPALGSFLWSPSSTAALNNAELANHDFLEALRNLAFTRQGKALRAVDYKNLGAEELGGVYESLLALTPQISADGARFGFAEFAGNERKTSGSYYTPDSLVQCLLDSALDPVVEEAIRGKTGPDAESAILGLKVCDPAVGSGHFLVGAAHRLARHLARVRAFAQGESEPSPLLYQHALRDVIGRCLYGVDINPMAAELCRVSLWLEALEPGRPLSFLDHHIRVGNSLIGATPELLAQGIPDEAFAAIEGDDKAVCKEFKAHNRSERKKAGMDTLFTYSGEPWENLGNLAQSLVELESIPDDTAEGIERRAKRYAELVEGQGYRFNRLLADAWCAAFVWKKTREFPYPITQDIFGEIRRNPYSIYNNWMELEIRRLRDQYQFFHWHLEFPGVFGPGSKGGFDAILGNPPWERPKPEPANFFAATHPDITNAQTSAVRDRLIERLSREDLHTFSRWTEHQRSVLGMVAFLTQSGRFRLSATGKFNLGNAFVEHSRSILSPHGRAGLLNVSGLATDDSGSAFISDLMQSGALVSFFDFENRQGLFAEVDSRYKFSAITIAGTAGSGRVAADFVFFAQTLDELRDPARHIEYSASDILLLNPLSGNCPIFRERPQAELVKTLYRRARLRRPPAEVLWEWDAEPTFLFVMSDHSDLFATREELGITEFDGGKIAPQVNGVDWLPLYESKMFHQFEHRWNSLNTAGDQHDLSGAEKSDPDRMAIPRYWMRASDAAAKLGEVPHRWLIALREVTNATNERTAIASLVPKYPVGHNAQVFRFRPGAKDAACFLANLNSFCLDFAVRTKVGGSHLSSFILRQIPLLGQREFEETCPWSDGYPLIRDWLQPQVLELVYTAWDLEPFAQDCGWSGPPFRWDEERRFLLRCELDAAFFHLYLLAAPDGGWKAARRDEGADHDETPEQLAELTRHFPTPRHAVDYIMETFPIVKRKDEEIWGDYRTKRVILEIYDAMGAALRSGQPYQTRLDPPPADPSCCHPEKEGAKP